jgi:hypothetical protein
MSVKRVPTIAIRELFQDVKSKSIYRIVYTGFGQGTTYLCQILGERLDIRAHSTDEFLWMCDDGNPERLYRRYTEGDPFSGDKIREQTDAGILKSESNWKIISGLVEAFDDDGRWSIEKLADAKTRRKYLIEYSEKHGHGMPILYKLLRRYLQRGMTPAAVNSQYPNCGHTRTNALHCSKVGQSGPISSEPIWKEYETRPGRPPSDTSHEYAKPSSFLERLYWQAVDIYTTWKEGPWVVPKEALDLLKRLRMRKRDETGALEMPAKAAIRNLLPSPEHSPPRGARSKPSQNDLVAFINYQLRRRIEVRDGTGHIKRLEFKKTDVVTLRQFNWFWLRTQPNFFRRRKRHPAEEELRHEEPGPGRARQHIKGPGQAYIIDATVLDAYAVSSLDRTIVLGRPCLYLIVDVDSGMIVGLYLGLEHPSREAAGLALVNMVTNKRQFCAEFGFAISDEDWPTMYLPDMFLADRGAEFRSSEPWRSVAEAFHVGISNTPVRRPTWRSVGERRFGIVPRGYQRASFGTVEKDFGTRTGRYYPWDARYTVAEITLMILRAIHVYHRTPIAGDQPPPPRMVYAGLADTPLNRWNDGVANNSGSLRAATPEEMRLAVYPVDKARMYPTGVLWRGAWYRSPSLRDEFWKTQPKRGKKSIRIEIRFDPIDMSEIRIKSYGYNEICEFDVRRNRHDLRGVSLAEWLELRTRNRKNRIAANLADQAEAYIHLHNTQIDNEMAAQEQREQLKEKGMKQPDASNMKQARAVQKRRDARARAALKAEQRAQENRASDPEEQMPPHAESPEAVELEIDSAMDDALYAEEV